VCTAFGQRCFCATCCVPKEVCAGTRLPQPEFSSQARGCTCCCCFLVDLGLEQKKKARVFAVLHYFFRRPPYLCVCLCAMELGQYSEEDDEDNDDDDDSVVRVEFPWRTMQDVVEEVALWTAAQEGRAADLTVAVQTLFRPSMPLAFVSNVSSSALCAAAANDHPACVRILLDAGADVNRSTGDNRVPLLLAAQYGSVDAAQMLLTAKADVRSAHELDDHRTPTMVAVANDQVAVLQLLLAAVPHQDVNLPAFMACKLGNLAVLRTLLGAKADVDVEDQSGYTLLGLAAHDGRAAVVQHLIQVKAAVETTTRNGFTPLMHAARFRHADVAALLLAAKADADKGGQTEHAADVTPLQIAVGEHSVDFVRLLLRASVNVNRVCVETRSTAIQLAVDSGDADMVRLLAAGKADVNQECHCDTGRTTLVHLAVEEEHYHIVRALADCKANVNAAAVGKYGTPLFAALRQRHVNSHVLAALLNVKADPRQQCYPNGGDYPLCVIAGQRERWCTSSAHDPLQMLLDAKADPNDYCTGRSTPLQVAVHGNRVGSVRTLLAAKARVDDTAASTSSLPPLFTAAHTGCEEVVRMLIEAKADIDKAYYTAGCINALTGFITPLLMAAASSRAVVVRLLVAAKADVDKSTAYGGRPLYSTPLVQAAVRGTTDIVRVLMEAKADVNRCDHDGFAPAYHAALGGHVSELKALVRAGADVDRAAPAATGWSPLTAAVICGNLACVRFLIGRAPHLAFQTTSAPYQERYLHVRAGRTPHQIAVLLEHDAVAAALKAVAGASAGAGAGASADTDKCPAKRARKTT